MWFVFVVMVYHSGLCEMLPDCGITSAIMFKIARVQVIHAYHV